MRHATNELEEREKNTWYQQPNHQGKLHLNRSAPLKPFISYFVHCPRKTVSLLPDILEDEDIQQSFEIPNEMTVQAFGEDKTTMPVFSSIDALRKDLLA